MRPAQLQHPRCSGRDPRLTRWVAETYPAAGRARPGAPWVAGGALLRAVSASADRRDRARRRWRRRGSPRAARAHVEGGGIDVQVEARVRNVAGAAHHGCDVIGECDGDREIHARARRTPGHVPQATRIKYTWAMSLCPKWETCDQER